MSGVVLACSWCDVGNAVDDAREKAYCWHCYHRVDVARAACDCAACLELQAVAAIASEASVPRRGELVIDGWGGRSYQAVTVEGETPTRYRVRAVGEYLRLPSRGRGLRMVLRSGTVLVPKSAVRFVSMVPSCR